MTHVKEDKFRKNDPNTKNSSCRYYSIGEFCSKKCKTNDLFSMFHLNIASPQYHKNDLNIVLDALKFQFVIIAILESIG